MQHVICFALAKLYLTPQRGDFCSLALLELLTCLLTHSSFQNPLRMDTSTTKKKDDDIW